MFTSLLVSMSMKQVRASNRLRAGPVLAIVQYEVEMVRTHGLTPRATHTASKAIAFRPWADHRTLRYFARVD
jgi:hypothetical protein